MFTSVLVANRGEIAVRIVRTLRRMGIRSVVVASIPDRQSLAVRSADASVLLEGYSAAETYLDVDAVIGAARAQGCEAIHPGYGFLSERADFAERCAAEGIAFVGPPPAVLRGMGDKSAARRLAVTSGVPVVPGWDGDDDDLTLQREAARIGFPVMLKARGGGGGRGMREVFAQDELPAALESARREALSAFGDGGLLLEKLVSGAHHVEVQVLADSHGNVLHLGERDCSVQRRHQKLIEESPSPVVDDALRAALTAAALRLAQAVGYVNAGTFEFLVAAPGASGERPFYFLEVNPRLQVEHPVTELVTGLDLVELQLRIASGELLPMTQEEIAFHGHAIEFRINAEDPRDGFKPSTGRVRTANRGAARFDSGFATGDVVPPQYDSLIAKAIVHGESRVQALEVAGRDLRRCSVMGVRTNVQLHRAIVTSDAFSGGEATVDWLENALPGLLESALTPQAAWTAAAAGLAAMGAGPKSSPFGAASWLGAGHSSVWLSDGEEVRRLDPGATTPDGGRIHGDVSGEAYSLSTDGPGRFAVRTGGPAIELAVRADRLVQGEIDVSEPGRAGQSWLFRLVGPPPVPRRARVAAAGATLVLAPLSGTVTAVRASVGDQVEAGQTLVLLEAMKMEHRVAAPSAGVVKGVNVSDRAVVREGDVLVELG